MLLDALFLGNPIGRGIRTLTLPMFLGISVRFCVSSIVAVGRRLRYGGICTKLLNVLSSQEQREAGGCLVGSCSGSDRTDSASSTDTYVGVVLLAARL